MEEISRTRASRSRTLLAARIVYHEGSATLDCVIRNMSETGAKLGCDAGVTIPAVFDLHIIQKNVTRRASLKWQSGTELGVAFLDAPNEAETQNEESALHARVRELEAENRILKARLRELTEG